MRSTPAARPSRSGPGTCSGLAPVRGSFAIGSGRSMSRSHPPIRASTWRSRRRALRQQRATGCQRTVGVPPGRRPERTPGRMGHRARPAWLRHHHRAHHPLHGRGPGRADSFPCTPPPGHTSTQGGLGPGVQGTGKGLHGYDQPPEYDPDASTSLRSADPRSPPDHQR